MQKMSPHSMNHSGQLSDSVDCQGTQETQAGKQQACIGLD